MVSILKLRVIEPIKIQAQNYVQTISNYFIFLLSNKQKQFTTLTTVKPCVNLKLTTDETNLSKSKIA